MLYTSPVWSRSGSIIIKTRYFLIDEDKETIERMKKEINPKDVYDFLAHLQRMDIMVEEVKPISLGI